MTASPSGSRFVVAVSASPMVWPVSASVDSHDAYDLISHSLAPHYSRRYSETDRPNSGCGSSRRRSRMVVDAGVAMTRVVGIYTRISQADHDTQTATHRQEAACRQLAIARGWPVVAVFEDVDISAYSGEVRPAFERMIDVIERGSVNGTVVWKLDRLVRKPRDFERFWDVCERRNAVLASVTEPIDSSTDLGLALVRMLVVMATFESATRGARVRALFEEVARRGDAPLGGERPWGLTEHWRDLDPEEAALLREAAKRIIGGEPLHRIVKDWTARGIAARNGTPWNGWIVRSPILRPRIDGLRISNRHL